MGWIIAALAAPFVLAGVLALVVIIYLEVARARGENPFR